MILIKNYVRADFSHYPQFVHLFLNSCSLGSSLDRALWLFLANGRMATLTKSEAGEAPAHGALPPCEEAQASLRNDEKQEVPRHHQSTATVTEAI